MSDTTVIGNVGEPELRHTPSGKPVLEFSLAENHSKKNQQGGWDKDGTTWRRVSLWDRKGEALYDVLKKGNRVVVTGAERIREWENKDGSKGSRLEMNARDVGIIVMPPSENSGNSTAGGGEWGGQQQDNSQWGSGPDTEPPF